MSSLINVDIELIKTIVNTWQSCRITFPEKYMIYDLYVCFKENILSVAVLMT